MNSGGQRISVRDDWQEYVRQVFIQKPRTPGPWMVAADTLRKNGCPALAEHFRAAGHFMDKAAPRMSDDNQRGRK